MSNTVEMYILVMWASFELALQKLSMIKAALSACFALVALPHAAFHLPIHLPISSPSRLEAYLTAQGSAKPRVCPPGGLIPQNKTWDIFFFMDKMVSFWCVNTWRPHTGACSPVGPPTTAHRAPPERTLSPWPPRDPWRLWTP